MILPLHNQKNLGGFFKKSWSLQDLYDDRKESQARSECFDKPFGRGENKRGVIKRGA